MNKRMVFNFLGQIFKMTAFMMLLPLVVSIVYLEWMNVLSFGIAIAAALAVGFALTLCFKPQNKTIYAKEGFVIVALSWIGLSLLGALPFVICGDIPNYIDAFFETVSGFTTTGASILTNVEGMSRGMLFWRSFTHWLGGMGVLVFVMALVPSISDRTIHVMKAEMPGPVVGKLVPKVRQTARILYLIYVALTLIEIVLLLVGGMPLFDSVVHTFGTAGTGGFGIKADSIGGYSPYLQWVITVFMLIFGVNFNLYFLLLIRRFRAAARSAELWVYLGVVALSTGIVAANIRGMYPTFSETIRHSAFQVASIITTTGYSTVNFDLWPELSKAVLLTLMFVGACAGSTGGGFKISRIVMLFKMMGRELRKMLHPRAVEAVRYEGKRLDEATLHSTASYLALYVVLFMAIFLLVSFDPKYGFTENFSAVAACYNNIGPGFGAVGAAGSYAGYGAFSKIILSVAMLFGRLEIYPLLFAFSPMTWRRK
ncbi:MAG: TrkH family potassium uptake protein [Clostridia bacterium]|nr:TrkH family potassium uptake protein [Clostridia bacterium]